MNLKLGIVQIAPVRDIDANIEAALSGIREMAHAGAQLVVLPEMWAYPCRPECFAPHAQPEGGQLWSLLSQAAREQGIWLIGGSVAELRGDKVYNTSYVFDDAGVQVAKYSKMHLFDVDLKGAIASRESDSVTPGDQVVVFDSPWGAFGLCICFDLRFSDLYSAMARKGARVIFCPSAFNQTTGPVHWALLQRVRALDAQAFTVGVDAGFDPDGPYPAYGHSVVCDPWGAVLYEAGQDAENRLVEIDLDRVDEVRASLPLR